MRGLHIAVLGLAVGLGGCLGESSMGPPGPNPVGDVCQAGISCCTQEELVCAGNPDEGSTCHCYKAWDCESAVDPSKCWQGPADTPDGNSGWSCQSFGTSEKCVRPGSDVPPGKNGWNCKKVGSAVECTRPTNTPDGTPNWDCSYNGSTKTCLKGAPQPGTDSYLPPTTDAGVPPPTDFGPPPPGWNCTKDEFGETVCKNAGGGMPPGGGDFKCLWKDGVITCEGSSPTPPGGNGWSCVQNELTGGWRCTKTVQPGDTPDGSGQWKCYSGTPFGGTVCILPPPPSQPGQECVPGTKKWCDGNGYCGWGQVTCGTDGKWKTKVDPQTGQVVLDCWELPDGRRPNTVCACFFFYWNKDCCENKDCIVPQGTNGQICPASAGKYCNYCNPLKPECSNPGAKCIVTSSNEVFCGEDCAGGKPCPTGASCQKVQVDSQDYWQCVPNDLSCYY